MKIEISIDCVDDTSRIPQGQVITWVVKGDNESRDVRMRKIAQIIVKSLKVAYPKPEDGKTTIVQGAKRSKLKTLFPNQVKN